MNNSYHYRSKQYEITSLHTYSSKAFQQYQVHKGLGALWFERSQHDKQHKQTAFLSNPIPASKTSG